jgi:hypothetical protein
MYDTELHKLAKLSFQEDVTLNFDIPFEWNLASFSQEVGKWLCGDDTTRNFSLVGLFSSNRFRSIVAPHITPQLRNSFKSLIYFGSFLYMYDISKQDDKRFRVIRDMAGREVLQSLDLELKSFRINVSSEDESAKWQALFLIIMGTILAINYISDKVCSVHRSYTFNNRLILP